jgi:hypothetical protein
MLQIFSLKLAKILVEGVSHKLVTVVAWKSLWVCHGRVVSQPSRVVVSSSFDVSSSSGLIGYYQGCCHPGLGVGRTQVRCVLVVVLIES